MILRNRDFCVRITRVHDRLRTGINAERTFMSELKIEPVIIVKDMPKPRRLATLSQAKAFVEEELRRGRPPAWRDLHRRLSSAVSAEDAIEAVGALRELLQLEDLIVPHCTTEHL